MSEQIDATQQALNPPKINLSEPSILSEPAPVVKSTGLIFGLSWIWILLIIVLVLVVGYFCWRYYNQKKSEEEPSQKEE